MPTCRHPDVQKFDTLRCCLSCGEVLFENVDDAPQGTNPINDDNSVSTYQYKRLNYELGQEVRLLVLYPGTQLEDLKCNIMHVNLLDKIPFEAVSYTWATSEGDKGLSRYVTCRGKRIAITKNCETVLRRLRNQGYKKRTLWIDAVSIDQNNLVERSHQVKLMVAIYSTASQVLAYIGSVDPRSGTSIATKYLLNHLEGHPDATSSHDHPITAYVVKKILALPYFDRVWVSAILKASCNGSTPNSFVV